MATIAIDYNMVYTAAFQKMIVAEAEMGNIERTGRKYGVKVSWIKEWQQTWSKKETNNNQFVTMGIIRT